MNNFHHFFFLKLSSHLERKYRHKIELTKEETQKKKYLSMEIIKFIMQRKITK